MPKPFPFRIGIFRATPKPREDEACPPSTAEFLSLQRTVGRDERCSAEGARPPQQPVNVALRRRWRSAAWCVLCTRWLSQERVAEVLGKPRAQPADPSLVDLIDLDIARTGGGQPEVLARRGRIRAMLLRHLAEDPELGYCQGMSFVAAVFAVASEDYAEAYRRFRAFTSCVRSLWLPGLPLLRCATLRFEEHVRGRRWFAHLSNHGVETSMYLPQPMLTLFSAWLPLPTLLACLDLLERGNLHGMLAVAVSVLDLASARLLRRRSLDALLGELHGLRLAAPQPEKLLAGAQRVLRSAGISPPVPRAPSLVVAAEDWKPLSARSRTASLDLKPVACRQRSDSLVSAPELPWGEEWSGRNWQEWVLWYLFSQ